MPAAMHKRLKRLTFHSVWLSSRSYDWFVERRHNNNAYLFAHAESSEDEGPGPDAAGAGQLVPLKWAHSLEEVTFFNIPPSKQRRETAAQIIFTVKPLEQTARDLIQGLRSLSSLRLHNPASGATCVRSVVAS